MPRKKRPSAKRGEEPPPPKRRPPLPILPPLPGPSAVPDLDGQILFNLQPRRTSIDLTYDHQDEFLREVTRLHGQAWNSYLFSKMRFMEEFEECLKQLREHLRCHICGDLVSDNALLPMDKNLKHGAICRECLVNNRCRCVHNGCKLTLIGFNNDMVFSILVKSYKKLCTLFLLSKKYRKMLERKLCKDRTFDAITLVVFLREGAFTGDACLKKSILLTQPDYQPPKPQVVKRNGVLEANLRPNAELEITPRSSFVANRRPTPCPIIKITPSRPSPRKRRAAPVIKLPPAKRWPEGAQALADSDSTHGNVYLGKNGYFRLGPVAGTSTGGITSPMKTTSPATPASVVTNSSLTKSTTRSPQKEKASEPSPTIPDAKKPRSPAKKGEQAKPLNKSCRCGNAATNPGKLTCCGQRCPCYVEGRGCIDCKCKGCRNPHLPGGKKLLEGMTAVVETRTNEAVPLHIPYITTQFYSNTGGQLMQPMFPLGASVASFNSYGIPVISVSPLMHQQQSQQ